MGRGVVIGIGKHVRLGNRKTGANRLCRARQHWPRRPVSFEAVSSHHLLVAVVMTPPNAVFVARPGGAVADKIARHHLPPRGRA
jgi:hypothetical protein